MSDVKQIYVVETVEITCLRNPALRIFTNVNADKKNQYKEFVKL